MKLYVLVRKDLKPEQIAVQAGHAVAEWCLENGKDTSWNKTLVYLGVENEYELEDWYTQFVEAVPFYEEYWNNELTAFALLGEDTIPEKLKPLKLLKF